MAPSDKTERDKPNVPPPRYEVKIDERLKSETTQRHGDKEEGKQESDEQTR
jgi:hypothetical protein